MSALTKLSINVIPAAVLSGGKSSRMGRDKSLIRHRGLTLTALSVQKLLKAGYRPVIVVGPKKKYGLPSDIEIIKESFRGKGPLSGIEAALNALKSDCLILPCDLPLLKVADLRRLRLAYRGKKLAMSEKPLPAIFDRRSLARIRRCLKENRLAVYPLLKTADRLKGISKRSLLNLNDKSSLKIVRSDKRVAMSTRLKAVSRRN